jgi:regulator of cell morphogenesis and NO signaling
MLNLSKSSVNDVLKNIRNSDILLKNIGIDVAQSGDRVLSDVFLEKKIDKDSAISMLKLLNKLSDTDIHWALEPTVNLINHIMNKYHKGHRMQLPALISLARQVEIKNNCSPYCPYGLADYLDELHNDLLVHMEKEEKILFPFLAEEKMSCIFTQVSLAMHNHDHEIHMLDKVGELTNNFILPSDADDTWKQLYVQLENFKDELLEHIRLENDLLFARRSS